MTRRIPRGFAALAALALAAAAPAALAAPATAPAAKPAPIAPATPAAAPALPEGRPQIGLGVSIVPFGATVGAFAPVEIYLPILVSREVRLEPSLGIRVDNGPTGGTDRRDLTLGLGAFLVRRATPTVDLLLGGRLKLNLAHASPPAPAASRSGTDLLLAGAVGGEYFPSPHFSFGLEADLGFFQNSEASGDDSGLLTTGLAFLRVYF